MALRINRLNAVGGTRTRTGRRSQELLRLQRLPFRHHGPDEESLWHRRRFSSGREVSRAANLLVAHSDYLTCFRDKLIAVASIGQQLNETSGPFVLS